MKQRSVWAGYLVVAAVVAVTYFVAPNTSLNKIVLYNGLGLLSVIALVVGIRRNRPTKAAPWWFFAAGMTSFLVADVIYYVSADLLGIDAFPSLADPFYQLMYPLVITGLALLTRAVLPGRDLPSLVDAVIIAVGAFVALWVFLMDSYVLDSSLPALGRLILIGQPTFDVLLLAVAVRLAVVMRTKAPAFILLTAGIGGLLVADVSYGMAQLTTGYSTGGFTDLGWMLFYVLVGAAALHPSMSGLTAQPAESGVRLTTKRLAVLSLATCAVPVVDLTVAQEGLLDQTVTTFGSIALFGLVLLRVVGLVRTVEEGRERLRHETLHDGLTGLANRAAFNVRLAEEISRTDTVAEVAVLFVDLDDFKTVNDSQGHAAGDELLRAVARRLRECATATDLVARLGGDEFAVLLPTVRSRRDAAITAERILSTIAEPLRLGAREVLVAASVGIAVQARHPDGADRGDAESLLRGADVAMYLAKSKGKGCFEFFEQSMYDDMVQRLQLKADLGMALEREELYLEYQPIVDLAGGVSGLEALLRWRHADRGTIPPVTFIPLAEETGLILPIGRWVLNQACAQAALWQDERPGADGLGVSVNISVRQLCDARLIDDVAEALRVTGLPPHLLTIEITESVLMSDGELSLARLQRIKQLGVKIAIDDFGTGYSSLSYLQKFPVDVIKIDRSFVTALADPDETRSSALIRTVVDLSSALNLVTVAEGIEDDVQLGVLESLNCQRGQGFYFSRPLDPAAVAVMLAGARGGDSADAQRGRLLGHVVEIHRGPTALDRVGADLDDLHADLAVPVMARRPWLSTWVETHPTYEPWLVVLRTPGDRGIAAAALLATRPGVDGLDVVGLGHGRSNATLLPARPGSAQALAEAVLATLEGLGQPWTLHLEQLPADDPVVLALAERLGAKARLAPDVRVPRVALEGETVLRDHLSRNTFRALKRARNRLATDGKEVRVEVASDPGDVADVLRDIEVVHRERDHDLGRASDLDEPSMVEFWRRVVLKHCMRGEVEVASLRIDGELAAYVISLLDGESYRVYDGRFATRFAEYAPGRLLEAHVLERSLADPRWTELDWWTGLSAEKLLTENVSYPRQWLAASSGSLPIPAPRPAMDDQGVPAAAP